ncbi:hypothetical protein MRB53_006582 [Persea americana]|uniref:Uncharacterized protein n=1 Tax=Persea americana TaxID=3435 RepID=A0ACC2MHM3_PERAE|nr:hypothetical protein MRB53_006582 [Persea americana]
MEDCNSFHGYVPFLDSSSRLPPFADGHYLRFEASSYEDVLAVCYSLFSLSKYEPSGSLAAGFFYPCRCVSPSSIGQGFVKVLEIPNMGLLQ